MTYPFVFAQAKSNERCLSSDALVISVPLDMHSTWAKYPDRRPSPGDTSPAGVHALNRNERRKTPRSDPARTVTGSGRGRGPLSIEPNTPRASSWQPTPVSNRISQFYGSQPDPSHSRANHLERQWPSPRAPPPNALLHHASCPPCAHQARERRMAAERLPDNGAQTLALMNHKVQRKIARPEDNVCAVGTDKSSPRAARTSQAPRSPSTYRSPDGAVRPVATPPAPCVSHSCAAASRARSRATRVLLTHISAGFEKKESASDDRARVDRPQAASRCVPPRVRTIR